MDLFAFIHHAHPTKVPTTVVNKPKGMKKKRKTASGASGSPLPPKRPREDYGTSSDAGASTSGKSLAVLQDLLDNSTLAIDVSAMAAVTVPFVTSSVTPTPERKSDGRTDSIIRPNLRTQHLAERFIISSDSSHHSISNDVDDELTSIVRSSMPPPPILTATVATTTIVGTTSAPVHKPGTGPVQRSIFMDSTSLSTAEANIAGPSQPTGVEVCQSMVDQLSPLGFFSQLRDIDYDQLLTEFNVGVARQACFSAEVMLRSEHNYRERKKFERKCQKQETEAAKAIRLCSQVATIKGTKASRVDELNGLKEQNSALKEEKNVLEKKVALTQDLSELGLSCDELCVKYFSLAAERHRLVGQVSLLEGTCSELRDEVSDEEIYPRFLTIIAGQRLAACIDHGKAGSGLVDVAAYNPFAEANYISIVNALRAVDFPLLAQLESQKDASMDDITGLLHLDGLAAEILEADKLEPSPKQLMLPIHQPEDQVVIWETSLSFSLDAVHIYFRRIRGDSTSQRLSIIDLMVFDEFTHKGSSSGSTYLSFYAWSWSSGNRQKFNDKIPKTVDEMFERVRAFIKGEVAVRTTSGARVKKEQFKGHKHDKRRRKLQEPFKEERRNVSSSGIIDLRVTMGKAERNKTVLIEFVIIKWHSPYNVIIGRTEMRRLRSVERLYGNSDTWKGCKVHERRYSGVKVKDKQEKDKIGTKPDKNGKRRKARRLEIIRIGPVSYRLELPEKLCGIHNLFHVSNLKKCIADENLVIPLKEIQLDDKLHFIEEPVEIIDREVKRLKQSCIPIVKVHWNSWRRPEFTWQREDFFISKYLHLFQSKKRRHGDNRAPDVAPLREGGCKIPYLSEQTVLDLNDLLHGFTN
nr:reverse transcriptase domain-containing protein [Tanacetum cinerariifolium]